MILQTGDVGQLKDLVSYGALGLVLLALMIGWLWTKPAVDTILKKLERAEQKLDANDDFIKTIVLPALQDSNDLLRRVTEYLWRVGKDAA